MERQQFLQWLRQYRHDLMNDLQIVQGYGSMGKYEKSLNKVNDLIERLKQERLLQTLNCDEFVFWLLSTSLMEHELNITFSVNTDLTELAAFDEKLTYDGQAIVSELESSIIAMTDVSVHVAIEGEEELTLQYDIHLPNEDQSDFMERLSFSGECLHAEQNEEKVSITLMYH
ncbi:Spo0B domain-containing protein [Alkalibacillus almallahensis]|uniref:Spo0B domain-containing protein n=1 Tax=Alkalibacillus almallahensis TaxID=1379154 RepID=UPI00141E5A0B|nr:Spo0B domain-containing protein [Alkalibacillus almallahensis]NIK11250.1 stage 0 sporulation protein B (sporulation initiation phosphotransferase) [Alkalibacillus almallahensis]